MNKLVALAIVCCSWSVSLAQYDSKVDSPMSKFRPGFMWFYTGLRPAKVERVRKYDRLIFDVTYNDWIGDRDIFTNHWASIGLNTNVMFDVPLSKGNTVALGIGLAHQYTVIRHNGNLVRDDVAGTTTWQDKQSGQTFDRSVLGGNSFAMPIELRFRKESWRHFKFHIGGRIGYQVNSFTKEVEGKGQNRIVTKDFNFPDQARLIYAAHLRFGFRNWALFAKYNFNKLFTNSNSTQLNRTQLGVSISLY